MAESRVRALLEGPPGVGRCFDFESAGRTPARHAGRSTGADAIYRVHTSMCGPGKPVDKHLGDVTGFLPNAPNGAKSNGR